MSVTCAQSVSDFSRAGNQKDCCRHAWTSDRNPAFDKHGEADSPTAATKPQPQVSLPSRKKFSFPRARGLQQGAK
jgi:hypothetical protein